MYTRGKILLLIIAFVMSALSLFAAPTSFLPMEDQLSTSRVSMYGASIDNIKPYRQSTPVQTEKVNPSFFGSKDIFICVFLLGVYVVFMQRRGQTRRVSF